MQPEWSKLQQLTQQSSTAAGAVTITVADVKDAIACQCTSVKDDRIAQQYCMFITNTAKLAKSHGCDVILQAGGIPVVVDCLRHLIHGSGWSDSIEHASAALYYLAANGSAAVKSAIRGVNGTEELLYDVSVWRDSHYRTRVSWAALTLTALGHKVCVIVCDVSVSVTWVCASDKRADHQRACISKCERPWQHHCVRHCHCCHQRICVLTTVLCFGKKWKYD